MSSGGARERVKVLDIARGPSFYIVRFHEGRYKSTRVVTAVVFPSGPIAMLDIDGSAVIDAHYEKIARAAATRADRKNPL
jgi:hypothetical protein